jgi:WD repeat-containing protein 61
MGIKVEKKNAFTGHNGSVYTLDTGDEPHLIFSGSSDRIVTRWNLDTQLNENFAAQFPAIIYAICYIPEKKLLLVGTSAGNIHILDLVKMQEIKILKHHTGPVFSIRYSLETGCFYSTGGDGNFASCSLEQLSLVKLKKLCFEKVRSIDFNYITSEIAVASGDCQVRIFDLHTLDEKNAIIAHGLSANTVRFSPDGKILLTGGRDAHLNAWDTNSYTPITSIPAHNYALYDIVFRPDGKLFATASRDSTIKIWDAATFEVLIRINKEKHMGHKNSVNKLIWSTYNNYLISTGDDRAIIIWEISEL